MKCFSQLEKRLNTKPMNEACRPRSYHCNKCQCIYFWGLRDEEINLYIMGEVGGGGSTSIFLFHSLENHDIQDFTRL